MINLIRDFVGYSEWIAAVAAIVYFYKYRHTALKYFLFLLWYIVLSEFVGGYIIEHKVQSLIYIDENGLRYNKWVYNLLGFVTFIMLNYIYYQYLKTKIFKYWIKLFAILFVVIYFSNWIFIQSFIKEGAESPRIIGSVFLIISIVFYFIEMLRYEEVIVYHKRLLFWISIGLLLYYAGTIPFTLKVNEYMLFPGVHKLFLIRYILATLMYLIFAFGFIWSHKEEKIE